MKPGVYESLQRNGLCACTIGWAGDGKPCETNRVYCLKPVTQVWKHYYHGHEKVTDDGQKVVFPPGWYPLCATCENHSEYDIIGIRDRDTHPEDPRNHAIAEPYPYGGVWTREKLEALDPPGTYRKKSLNGVIDFAPGMLWAEEETHD